MWKEPKLEEIDATDEIKDLINKSIYWNSEGALVGSSFSHISGYIALIGLLWIGSFGILEFIIISSNIFILIFRTVLQYGLLIILIRLFYKWGFSNYREAWYYFDEKEEILIVIRLVNKNWEVIEIPYEEIDEIEWNNDDNGYAIIKSYGMEFETNRSKDKRASSVTDLWGELARTSAKMTHWPIILICSKCDRKFGHHIGTAVCPWDETMLIDPKVKGGYEIKEAHPDDFDRI